MYVCKHMRQEVQVYVTIELKSLNQRFEESDEGDRQMGFLFIVVITIKYLQLIDMGGLRTTGHREWYTVMEAGVNYLQHQYVKTRGIK